MEEIHIGSIIKRVMNEQGRKTTWLAEKICRHRSSVHEVYNKKDLDTFLLMSISEALGVNFFKYYSDYFEVKCTKRDV